MLAENGQELHAFNGARVTVPCQHYNAHAHTSHAIQSAIERADAIEQRTHGLPLHAIQSATDLRDAMINALARLSARTDKLASDTVTGSPLSATE